MGGRRVSIKDVAREAGVSVTTVSHALNGKGRLNAATRQHVREVADRLNYRPNPAARSLVSGKTGLIAAMASLPLNPPVAFTEFAYYTELIGAASGAAVDHDYALVVAPPARSGFVWDRVPLDGVIVIDPIDGEPALPALRERGIPFVTVGLDPRGHERDAVVASDEERATCAVLDHLRSRGATRVALLSIPPVNAFVRDTIGCYGRWCQREGQAPAIEVMDVQALFRKRENVIADAVLRLLEHHGADGLYAPIEHVGVAVEKTLLARGVRIPDDVLLVTTHDGGLAAAASPPITTLEFDHKEQGRRAATLLLDLIEGRRRAPAVELVPTKIVERASTARA